MAGKKARPPIKCLASTQVFSYLPHNHNLNRNLNLLLDKMMEIMIKIMIMIKITIMGRNQNGSMRLES
ncbi:MAG TPA: hypothetical protein DCZ95_00490 [Verrucomicrobia bacterium]|nr:MAG: hypothetical protein A2X46_05870 [Lentisphaerae bacterium GWF2_57_35]HBA82547.1 hypothetical protein [Verrucomicrobiota bacterium]